jgi:putative hydrolase of the HAD superfamily
MYKNLIFDLDDTLLICSKYYLECKAEFIKYAHKRTGVKEAVITSILDGVDLACMGLDDGFGKERYPRSFAATSAVLDIIRGMNVDEKASQVSYVIGDSVFTKDYPLFPKSIETLEWCLKNEYNIFLYSKGDYNVQMRKIHINGLDKLFDMSHIYIVNKKGGPQLEQILNDHSLIKSETVMIGDSLRDDIGSAHAAGIDSIHVWETGRKRWQYETVDFKPTHTITDIAELHQIVAHDIYYSWST